MSDKSRSESFEEFRRSFYYGSRPDMNFKFMSNLSDEDASKFLQELLWKLGDASNDGELEPLLELYFYWQTKAYTGKPTWEYEDMPFTKMKKPLAEAKIGLIASSGHFIEGDDPKPFGEEEMTQEEAMPRIMEFLQAEPILSKIPVNTPKEKIKVRHPGYDIRAAIMDINTVLPIDRMKELEEDGVIGEFSENAFSFVGATAQTPLQNEHAPEWAKMILSDKVDGMILVPV